MQASEQKVRIIMTWMNKFKNAAQISRGRAKETAGKMTGDEDLTSEGVSDQKAGNLKQAGEKVRDAFKDR
jgi:uncharacterized protein YjbJ (UPF0337 family)